MDILTVMVVMALIVVIATLMWGVGSMAHGGSYDKEHSEQIMFLRVAVQAFAVALVLAALLITYFR